MPDIALVIWNTMIHKKSSLLLKSLVHLARKISLIVTSYMLYGVVNNTLSIGGQWKGNLMVLMIF